MPRTPIFFKHTPTTEEKRAVRHLCATLLPLQFSLAGKARLSDLFDPVEPTLVAHLLTDLARRRGYNSSPTALVLDHKSYYLRKNHMYYCIFTRMQAELEEQLKGGNNNG